MNKSVKENKQQIFNQSQLKDIEKKSLLLKSALENFIQENNKSQTTTFKPESKTRLKFLKSRKIIVLIILMFFSASVFSQNVVVTDDDTYTSASTNALLEVKAENGDKGILIPRLTTAQRTAISLNSNNDKGLLVYDSDTKSFWYYDGSLWVEINNKSITDSDGDTKIQVEESTDEDIIRFDNGGSQSMELNNGNLGIGVTTPNEKLEIDGNIRMGTSNRIDFGDEYRQITFTNMDDMSVQSPGAVSIIIDNNANGSESFSVMSGSRDPASADTLVTITDDGKMGIGTSNPIGELQIIKEDFGSESLMISQDNFSSVVYTSSMIWQTFKPTSDTYISKIGVYSSEEVEGSYRVKLYEGEGVGGNLLATSTIDSRLYWDTYGYLYFEFSNPVNVNNGNTYTFEIEFISGGIKIMPSSSSTYPNGYCYLEGGAYYNWDLRFKVFKKDANTDPKYLTFKDGKLSVGLTNPSYPLNVNGDAYFNGSLIIEDNINLNGDLNLDDIAADDIAADDISSDEISSTYINTDSISVVNKIECEEVEIQDDVNLGGSLSVSETVNYSYGSTSGTTKKVESMWRGTVLTNGIDYMKVYEDNYLSLYLESTSTTETRLSVLVKSNVTMNYSVLAETNNPAFNAKVNCTTTAKRAVSTNLRYYSQGSQWIFTEHQSHNYPLYKVTVLHNDLNTGGGAAEYWSVIIEAYYK